MARLLCIADVIMRSGDTAGKRMFTKGLTYRSYTYKLREDWDVRSVVCAKNDNRIRHTIKDEKFINDNQGFFERHFRVLAKGEAIDCELPTV